ncbi:LLM class flavin-dependent oxidoreductase [Saccharopolyspora sp. WRP15-2]|uniref:LLM class flavin-dependent oxidoreductase n=1 Tax=Saccharopolyspora oryzae TaxID=2997343 RepID=A0ABT4USN6_9PSEU|nr:LLM class flavin-dependent oxidoreductase [Saccharopolyspora oryzae]MDA3624734.1 LLM class flavin-dependent oxidoreductase [Saccharopolyspora oryzae]
MEIGIGLPGHVPGVDGRTLVEWARRAEARGFSTLSVSDRLVWSTPEPLTALAAAAGATERIKLLTTVLIAPLHNNHALFAKQTASIDQLAGAGRLHLGLAPGLRDDDFTESGVDFSTRGKQFDALLDRAAEVWGGQTGIGPAPATDGGPKVLFGGMSPAAIRRVVTKGTGWIAGDATVADVEGFAPGLREAWTTAGREGEPTIVASVMYALGPDARQSVEKAISAYYAFGGSEYVDYGIDIAHTTPESITAAVADFEKAGVHELLFMGNDANPDQVDLLADALGL